LKSQTQWDHAQISYWSAKIKMFHSSLKKNTQKKKKKKKKKTFLKDETQLFNAKYTHK
jgi:hypothetical protein